MGASAFNRARREAAAKAEQERIEREAAEADEAAKKKPKKKKVEPEAAPTIEALGGLNEHGMENLPQGAQGERGMPAEEPRGE